MRNKAFQAFNMFLIIGTMLLAGCQSNSAINEARDIKRVKIHYQLGLDALHKNQLPKAFSELMKAEEIDPSHAKVLDALAYAWRLRGNYEKAESYYQRAIQAGAGSSAYNNYGSLLLELKQFDKAKTQLEKALQDPRYRNQFIAYINLGDALLGLKKLDEAISSYRQAGFLNPNQSLSRIKEANAYVEFDRLNHAQALYEKLLKEEASNRAALEGLLHVLALKKDIPTARKQLEKFKTQSITATDRAWAVDELEKLRHP